MSGNSSRELSSIVPQEFLDLIRDRIKAGVADAESLFAINHQEEDALTGALGQAISTPRPIRYTTSLADFTYHITTHKLRGRGDGAEEKQFGADGVFQVEVFENGARVFVKGLPFQAKNGGGFLNARTRRQSAAMLETTGSGVVVRFSPAGYTAVDARKIVATQNSASKAPQPKQAKLSATFGDEFIDCKVGRLGLFYSEETSPPISNDVWAITTQIDARSR
jgi:hypothetical protein